MAQLKNISAFILHLPDLLNVRFLLFLLRGIITTQKAEALDLPWKKTSCPPPPCPPFLSGPVEEVISTDLCVTRTIPTQQLMPPSLRNTMGPKGLRKEKGKKVCNTSWGGGCLLAGQLPSGVTLNSCRLSPPGPDVCREQASPFCLSQQPQL